jgi:hypothetical protein
MKVSQASEEKSVRPQQQEACHDRIGSQPQKKGPDLLDLA